VHTKFAGSGITVGKQAYIDMAFITRNFSYNDILKFGRPDSEHTMYINEFACLFCSCSLFRASVGDISVSVTDTPALRAPSSLQRLIICVFPTREQRMFSLCTILHDCILGS
jgi:hypothetical protein